MDDICTGGVEEKASHSKPKEVHGEAKGSHGVRADEDMQGGPRAVRGDRCPRLDRARWGRRGVRSCLCGGVVSEGVEQGQDLEDLPWNVASASG